MGNPVFRERLEKRSVPGRQSRRVSTSQLFNRLLSTAQDLAFADRRLSSTISHHPFSLRHRPENSIGSNHPLRYLLNQESPQSDQMTHQPRIIRPSPFQTPPQRQEPPSTLLSDDESEANSDSDAVDTPDALTDQYDRIQSLLLGSIRPRMSNMTVTSREESSPEATTRQTSLTRRAAQLATPPSTNRREIHIDQIIERSMQDAERLIHAEFESMRREGLIPRQSARVADTTQLRLGLPEGPRTSFYSWQMSRVLGERRRYERVPLTLNMRAAQLDSAQRDRSPPVSSFGMNDDAAFSVTTSRIPRLSGSSSFTERLRERISRFPSSLTPMTREDSRQPPGNH